MCIQQNIFSLYHLFLHDIKIYFHSVKMNFYSVRNIFIICIFSIQVKYIFFYMNFSFNTFLVSISGLPFVFTKARILFSVCNGNNSTRRSLLMKHRAFSQIIVIKSWWNAFPFLEAATGGVLQKEAFLKDSANSQEKTCVGVFF